MNRKEAYLISFFVMLTVMFIPNNVTMKAVKSPWYNCIRPVITPPNYVFPIVWTILYIFIGIALAQTLLLREMRDKYTLLFLYFMNLSSNVLWSFLYFSNHDLLAAFYAILIIIVTTAMILYYTYSILPRWVFAILIPYQGWILFAALLNYLSIGKQCKY